MTTLLRLLFFIFLILITPFGIILSFFPAFHGPKEWFEFMAMAARGEV